MRSSNRAGGKRIKLRSEQKKEKDIYIFGNVNNHRGVDLRRDAGEGEHNEEGKDEGPHGICRCVKLKRLEGGRPAGER